MEPPVNLRCTHLGPPQGARRHRTALRGGHARAYHDPRHVSEESALASSLATALPEGWSTEDRYRVVIVCWHARPARMKRKADRGTGPIPYRGKPDADNIAKLALDAATRAGVWRDDTQVSQLVVVRWWLPLGSDGVEQGLPRLEISVGQAMEWRNGGHNE